jgi:hypothetical protein
MCRVWPELRCVGVDTFDKPLALARDNVDRAGLADRIELRKVAVEQLEDASGFDFAWLPSFFVAKDQLASAIARLHGAMRPGGWAIVATISPTGTSRSCASGRLLAGLWGGESIPTADGEAMLTAAGFTAVRTLPGPPGAGLIVGQRQT